MVTIFLFSYLKNLRCFLGCKRVYISILDSEIVYHYSRPHADYIPLSATPGSGVAMGRESKVKTYNHIPE